MNTSLLNKNGTSGIPELKGTYILYCILLKIIINKKGMVIRTQVI